MTTLLSYGYLPDITVLVSRILDLLMNCIDHILFIKLVGERHSNSFILLRNKRSIAVPYIDLI